MARRCTATGNTGRPDVIPARAHAPAEMPGIADLVALVGTKLEHPGERLDLAVFVVGTDPDDVDAAPHP
jgi:hypothetical protein